ncbi:TPA: HNH endonuclease [Vibrio vulnificus]|nr:HNH endonuclease [Vibrio vulnificus]
MILEELEKTYNRLILSCNRDRARATCLNNWSKFIRRRDNNTCVICGSIESVSAHHIVRKSLIPQAQYLPGNGITLCKDCHKEMHEGFNGKPDTSLPMDTQGGEKIEGIAYLFGVLRNSSNGRESKYYALSPDVLRMFKQFQGYDIREEFTGNDVCKAHLIWQGAPRQVINAILRANGF